MSLILTHPFLPFKIASFQAQSSEEVEVGPGITWPSSGPLNLKEVVKDARCTKVA